MQHIGVDTIALWMRPSAAALRARRVFAMLRTMQPRRTLASFAASVLGLAAVLAVFYGAWSVSARADTQTRYRFGNEGWLQGTLPLAVSGARDVVQIQTRLAVSGTVTRWRLITDGCLLDAALNGERVTLDAGRCGTQEVRLRGLNNGENELLVSVRGTPPIGFDLAPSPWDPVALALELLSFLCLAVTLFLLRRFLHPDRTGTIFVWTFLLGTALRAFLAMQAAPGPTPAASAFLLSVAALSVLHVAAFSLAAGRGRAYLWTAGLLSACLPLLSHASCALELTACAVTAAAVLWWAHARTPLWLGLLALLFAGTALDAAFLGLWAGALLCLFRRPDMAPGRQLGMFLLTCAALAGTLLALSPVPALSSDVFRAAVADGILTVPFTSPAPFFLLLLAVLSMLRLRPDGLRAARILLLLGGIVCVALAWLYGGTAMQATAVLLPAACLLAADGMGKLAARRLS